MPYHYPSQYSDTPPQKSLLYLYLQTVLPLLGLLLFTATIHLYATYEADRSSQQNKERLNIALAKRTILADIHSLVSDVLFLADEIQSESRYFDQNNLWYKRISEEFSSLSKRRALYDQIRLINPQGIELIRVNYFNGDPHPVTSDKLQDKSQRYYFREALKLQKGEVYLSPLDLNVEDNKIENPIKPMMRVAAPVFDHRGVKLGVIFLNYFGEHLIENFRQSASNIADHSHLLTEDGFWLSSPNPEDDWGFMLDHKKNFRNLIDVEWKIINQTRSGQFYSRIGLFTYETVYPFGETNSASGDTYRVMNSSNAQHGYYWHILSLVPASQLNLGINTFIRQQFPLYLSLLLMLIFGSYYFAKHRRHHHAIEAQSEYERRFRHTLENIHLAAVTIDRYGKVIFCNDYLLDLIGWKLEELLGNDWFEKTSPEPHSDHLKSILFDSESKHDHISIESTIISHAGEKYLISWNITFSYTDSGGLLSITAIGEDITQQRINQNEILKLYRAIEQSPSIVTITDTKGVIEYVNPKFTELTGYTSEEVIGKKPNILKSGETSKGEYSELWKALSLGHEWRGEFHNRHKDGSLYWESAMISPIRNSDGVITHYLAVKEDITERKRLELEVDERNRELARSQVLAVLGQMSSMIAHDLRNPLSSVKMTMQIINKLPAIKENNDTAEMSGIALEQIKYMENILADLLTYAKPDTLKPEWLSIDKIINMSIILIQKSIDENDVNISTNFASGLPTIHADETRLRQAISNLIGNAIQAVKSQPEGKRNIAIDCHLLLESDGTKLHITICDNGEGFDEKQNETLFEPFHTTHSKGTGLGLPIVKRIIEQHNGTVSLSSTNHKGACASILLPVEPLITYTDSKHN
ncbi:MAG: PAS domain S-box protein [Chromatiales bacterium]|nr:PAS domain S-box protein [Chromatiales bacterium]